MDEEMRFVERGKLTPAKAGFSLTLSDGAMAPYFPQGSTVFVDASRPPAEFQAGIFYYRGKILCRQCCEDMTGTLYLLPADPALGAQCISVSRSERSKCLCLGAVLSDIMLPEPVYY